jgi:hypothetical protein
MKYLGDIAEDQPIHFKWNTNDVAGASITPSTPGTIYVYKDDSIATEVTTGVTDTRTVDSLIGVHHCKIVTTDAFYEAGKEYTVVLKAAVIDGQTVNACLAQFSIENRFMRGTNSAALASVCTEARLSELDEATAGKMANQVDLIQNLVGGLITLSGTASAGSLTSITLTGGVATIGYYAGQTVVITGGTGAGQARTILSYAASTVATVTRDFAVAPNATSTFIVLGADWPAILEAGTATAGGVATITLEATASAISDTYKNNFIMITAGTGLGQTRLIAAYDGATKIATIIPNWTTNPAAGSVYQILPAARVDVGGWAGALATLSAGSLPNVNAAEISEDATAADNLETACDGGSYNIGGGGAVAASVTGAVGSVTGNVGGNVVGSVGSVTGNVTVGELVAAALADLFNTDSGTTYGAAVSGSPVKEIADNAGSGATNPNMLLSTAVNVVTDQTHFTISAGSDIDNAYKDQVVVLYDLSNSNYPSVRTCSAYTGATKTITLDAAPDFTIVTGQADGVKIFVATSTILTGTGSNLVTLTIEEVDTTPIPDVKVTIMNSDSTVVIATDTTDTNGEVSFSLDDATYKVLLRRIGFTFTVPETLIVDETPETATYNGTEVVVQSAPDPDICRMYEYCVDQDGDPLVAPGPTNTAAIIDRPYDDGAGAYETEKQSGVYNSTSGLLYWDIVRGATVLIDIDEVGIHKKYLVPDQATARLGDLTPL